MLDVNYTQDACHRDCSQRYVLDACKCLLLIEKQRLKSDYQAFVCFSDILSTFVLSRTLALLTKCPSVLELAARKGLPEI